METLKLEVPASSTYLISKPNKLLLEVVQKMSARGENVNVLIRGNTGNGKSQMVTQFAAVNKRPLAVLEVGTLSESR